jgi:hypothetical protein
MTALASARNEIGSHKGNVHDLMNGGCQDVNSFVPVR